MLMEYIIKCDDNRVFVCGVEGVIGIMKINDNWSQIECESF